MKQQLYRAGLLALLLGFFSGLIAQDAKAILAEIQATYEEKSTLSYQMQMDYYNGVETDEVAYSAIIDLTQDKSSSYSRIETGADILEQFIDQDLVLEVNHQAKTIYYRQTGNEVTEPQTGVEELLALAELEGMQVSTTQGQAYPGIRLSAPQASGTVLELFYDIQYRIVESRLRVEVDQRRYQGQLNNRKIICHFDYSKSVPLRKRSDFLHKTSSTYAPAPEFAAYTLVE